MAGLVIQHCSLSIWLAKQKDQELKAILGHSARPCFSELKQCLGAPTDFSVSSFHNSNNLQFLQPTSACLFSSLGDFRASPDPSEPQTFDYSIWLALLSLCSRHWWSFSVILRQDIKTGNRGDMGRERSPLPLSLVWSHYLGNVTKPMEINLSYLTQCITPVHIQSPES